MMILSQNNLFFSHPLILFARTYKGTVKSEKQLLQRLNKHINGRGGACSAQSGRGKQRPYIMGCDGLFAEPFTRSAA
jgi:hypothetical protein